MGLGIPGFSGGGGAGGGGMPLEAESAASGTDLSQLLGGSGGGGGMGGGMAGMGYANMAKEAGQDVIDTYRELIRATGITDTTSTTDQDMSQQLAQLVNQIMSSQQVTDESQLSSGTVQAFNEEQTLNVENLLAQVSGMISDVDPTAAREAAVGNVLQAGIGKVIESGQNAGAFDSSVQATSANRLGAEAARVGAAQETQARLQQQATMADAAAKLNEILKGGTTTTDTKSIREEREDRDTTQSQETAQTTDTQTVTDEESKETRTPLDKETIIDNIIHPSDYLADRKNKIADSLDPTNLLSDPDRDNLLDALQPWEDDSSTNPKNWF